MKGIKILALIVGAALFLTPATAMASSKFSFSLNLFDCFPPMVHVVRPCPPPMFFVPPPPPIVEHHVFVPAPRPVVREYHHYYHHSAPRAADVTILPYPLPVPRA